MEQIFALVLTVATNALVTGIILFLFQKRIESSIAKKNFEHQIKFSKIYNKSVEVIDTLRQKMIALSVAVTEANIEVSSIIYEWEERHENEWFEGWKTSKRQNEIHNLYRDLKKYKDENIIYIPDRYTEEINKLVRIAFELYQPSINTNILDMEKDKEGEYLGAYRMSYKMSMIKVTNEKEETYENFEYGEAAIKLINKMGEKYIQITKRLEEIHREVANFTD